MSLTTRIEKLEREAGNSEQGMIVHWQFAEGTQRLSCAGQDITRQHGESLSAFTDRAVAEALATASGKVLWMNSSAA